MEEIILSEKDRKLLLAELESYGIFLPLTDKQKNTIDISILETFVNSLKNYPYIYRPNAYPAEWSQVIADYIGKLTIASVLFFCMNPWAALWWPHLHFYRSRKTGF